MTSDEAREELKHTGLTDNEEASEYRHREDGDQTHIPPNMRDYPSADEDEDGKKGGKPDKGKLTDILSKLKDKEKKVKKKKK